MTAKTASANTAAFVSPPPGESHVRFVLWTLAAVATFVLAVVTAVSFPDRISFINDEPRQLAKAYYSNKAGTLAPYGLQGNFQFTYGPTATQIYQVILLFTQDPLTIAAVRAGLSAAITVLGLLWLARTLRLNPWFAAAISLAPFLWVYHRIIWDASWAIPIGTLGLAAYAAFVARGGGVRLGVAIFCTLILPFIHPQDVLLSAPIGLHMLWRHWRSLLRLWPAVVIPLAVVLVLNWQYIQHVRKEIRQMRESGGSSVSVAQYPEGVVPEEKEWIPPRAKSFLSPFLSGRILSGYKFVDGGFTSDDWGDRAARWGKAGSLIIYPLIWLGLAVAFWSVFWRFPRSVAPWEQRARLLRRTAKDGDSREPAESDAAATDAPVAVVSRADPTPARRAIAIIAMGSALFQALLFGAKKIPIEPQYFFGTFVVHVVLAWYAVEWLKRYRLETAMVLVYGLSVGAITFGQIYLDSVRPLTGSPRAARPEILPLGMQVEAAAALNNYADDQVMTDVSFYQRFPQAMRSLRLLMPPKAGKDRPTAGNLVLTFGDGPNGPGTKLVVIEARTAAQVPADAKPLNVRPLPNGWLPGAKEE
ncbi:hypothetical protein [Humisphaera borealis]|uniref:Uncharacterized protein n=1 Tax=Humisphaera borealis TaxID=2807512 RepID=A0A7M2WWS9_9BACT|nr:hypothetical protein [Humisphaera borealis]QOV89849.1 hypothetical protein IPV69_00295 [Humisphaera borealis]